jgi:predicted urease superfamily metal-dependent hydrolase
MRASIEQRIAGGVGDAGHVHIEKGDTMWSFVNRVLDAAQDGAKAARPDLNHRCPRAGR